MKVKNTPAPAFNLDEEFEVQEAVKSLIKTKVLQSAHDISDGGLFVTLAESTFNRGLGFELFTDKNIRKDAFLFGESQSRVVVTVKKESETDLIKALREFPNVKFNKIGFVQGAEMRIDNDVVLTVAEAKDMFDSSLESYLK